MPKPRVGVIGGGQLAWMMGMEAQNLGIELIVQTPNATDPAVQTATDVVLAAVEDAAGSRSLAMASEVITFENEFVNLDELRKLAQTGVCFRPALSALEPLLDKYTQRQFLAAQGLPNPPYVRLAEPMLLRQLDQHLASMGFPVVMKARRLGYDGQGTFILKSAEAVRETWQRIGCPPVLLEAFIPFEKELAVIVARSSTGEIVTYPVVETQQVNQVCRRVIAPAAVPEAVQVAIDALARKLIQALAFVGVLGIELFLTPDHQILINEVAPRTHNSGHYTLDACQTSQFAQQLRAVLGMSLGSTALTCDRALMVNLLGYEQAHHDYPQQRQQLVSWASSIPGADIHVHWYGKKESRPGRKLGHVTVCLQGAASWPAIAQKIETLWYPILPP